MYYTSICWQTRCHIFFILISRVWKTVTNASMIKQVMKKCLQKNQPKTIAVSQKAMISSWLTVVKKRQQKTFGSVLCLLKSIESE